VLCAECGEEHDLGSIDPAFGWPDSYAALSPSQQESHGRWTPDFCTFELPGIEPRFFIRAVIPVDVAGVDGGIWWGVWIELAPDSFHRILKSWDDPEQEYLSPCPGKLANQVPGYAATLGLDGLLRMTGLDSRPAFQFPDACDHPFAEACRDGVTAHVAQGWLDDLAG